MPYQLLYTHRAKQDWKVLKKDGHLADEARCLLTVLERNPWENPPPLKKLTGPLHGAVSRRLNRQHRLVYQVLEEDKCVKVLSMWTHYGD